MKIRTKMRSRNQMFLESLGWEKVGKLWLSPYTRNWHNLKTALEIEKGIGRK